MALNGYLTYHVQILYFCNNDIRVEVFNTIRICIHLKSDIRISLTLPYTIQLYMPPLHHNFVFFRWTAIQCNQSTSAFSKICVSKFFESLNSKVEIYPYFCPSSIVPVVIVWAIEVLRKLSCIKYSKIYIFHSYSFYSCQSQGASIIFLIF